MKKRFVVVMILAAAIALAGCANNSSDSPDETDDTDDTDDTTGTALTVTDSPYVSWALPSTVASGTTVSVELKGTNNGTAGFRCWLIDDAQTTNSNQYTGSLFNSFTDLGGTMGSGQFSFTYELTATAPATNLFLKAPSWDSKIQGIEIDAVSVTINGTTTAFVPSDGLTGD